MEANPGRFSFSVPRPYRTHEPIDGRTKFVDPQCRKSVAGPCATPSVCIEWMKQRSSTCLLISGKSPEHQRPLWPCWANGQSGFITRCSEPRIPVLARMRASSKASFLPSSFARRGL